MMIPLVRAYASAHGAVKQNFAVLWRIKGERPPWPSDDW
jgi:hypothetical protein